MTRPPVNQLLTDVVTAIAVAVVVCLPAAMFLIAVYR